MDDFKFVVVVENGKNVAYINGKRVEHYSTSELQAIGVNVTQGTNTQNTDTRY